MHASECRRSLITRGLTRLLLLCFALNPSASICAAQVSLVWNDNSSDESGFIIEQAIGTAGFLEIGRVEANVVQYVDTKATAGLFYSYRVCAFNAAGNSEYSNVVSTLPSGTVNSTSRLSNLSVRALAGNGSDTLIAGFATNGARTLLVRGIGPSLAAFGVSAPLSDPVLSLDSGPQFTETNDDWGSGPNPALIAATSARLGAFALPAGSRDAAMLSTFGGGSGTAMINGNVGATGTVLLELYDASENSTGRLVNVSARGNVGSGSDVLIVGFVITGEGNKQILIRAIGPSLADFGVTGILGDPSLALHRQGTAVPLQQNDNWGGVSVLTKAFELVGAFDLPNLSRDAALLAFLPAGAYTAQVSGVNNTSGVALVELYEVP